jgi:hypothetical protein
MNHLRALGTVGVRLAVPSQFPRVAQGSRFFRCPEGAPLNSYYSDQEAKVANIIVRRDQLRGAYGDIGFASKPDARLAMIKDELDEHGGYGAKWLGRLQQVYKEKQTLAMARAKGYTLQSREVIETSEGELVRLQFVTRRQATMQEKTITITVDEQANSTLDLEGFAGRGCEKVSDDFRGGESLKVERKKPAYYTGHVIEREKNQR